MLHVILQAEEKLKWQMMKWKVMSEEQVSATTPTVAVPYAKETAYPNLYNPRRHGITVE